MKSWYMPIKDAIPVPDSLNNVMVDSLPPLQLLTYISRSVLVNAQSVEDKSPRTYRDHVRHHHHHLLKLLDDSFIADDDRFILLL